MENFKFRLQRVLDIKIKNEEESKIKYSKAQNEKRVVEKELDDLKQMYKKYENEIDVEDHISRIITFNYLNSLSNNINIKSNELSKKEELLNEARVNLLNKQIERKSLEKLKENKFNLHKKKEELKEQATNDEFGMYSFLRHKSEALSNFKTNSVEVKGNGTEGNFLKSLNNLINSEEFNGEENIEAENIPNVKVDIEDLLNIEFNEDIKTAENIIVNEEVKSDKNIEIKDVIQSYEKDELIEFVEDDKEDELNKIDENLIILANRIFNNISYKEKQQFDITEDNADFKNNTQMDMNIVNNNVNKQQEIVDNLIAFVESSSNKDNIQNKIDFIKKTFDFNEVKSKLTDLVESNFNLQNSKDEFTNNVEKSLDFASELEAISNFKVLSMKDNIKVNDSKNEINFLNNIAMTNNNANLEVKTENLEPHVVRSEYIANDIVESINYLKVNNLEEIKVKMNPKDLGELHIKIIKENNVEKVFITLHNSESFKLVKDNVAEIKNHLNNLDINVNEVNVEMKSENRDDFSQNLNQQFNKGNNKQQRRAVKFEIENENESSIENDLLKTDSNINRLI